MCDAREQGQDRDQRIFALSLFFWLLRDNLSQRKKPGSSTRPLPDRSELHHRRQLFQQIGQRPPKVSVVPLQGLDLVGVNAAVGVHMDCHLVEVVGAPPLEGHQLPDVREVNMEHIAIQGHFPHIGPHVGNARLGHAFPDQRLLLRRHHHMKMDTAAAFLCHRSSRSRLLCLLGGLLHLVQLLFRGLGRQCRAIVQKPILFRCTSSEIPCLARFHTLRRDFLAG